MELEYFPPFVSLWRLSHALLVTVFKWKNTRGLFFFACETLESLPPPNKEALIFTPPPCKYDASYSLKEGTWEALALSKRIIMRPQGYPLPSTQLCSCRIEIQHEKKPFGTQDPRIFRLTYVTGRILKVLRSILTHTFIAINLNF